MLPLLWQYFLLCAPADLKLKNDFVERGGEYYEVIRSIFVFAVGEVVPRCRSKHWRVIMKKIRVFWWKLGVAQQVGESSLSAMKEPYRLSLSSFLFKLKNELRRSI